MVGLLRDSTIAIILIFASLVLFTGCKSYVNVPGDPNGLVQRDFWHQGQYSSGYYRQNDSHGNVSLNPTNEYQRFQWEMNLLKESVPENLPFYLLFFDDDGALVNRETIVHAIQEIQRRDREKGKEIKRIVILALGWSHDYTSAEEDYRELLTSFINHRGGVERNPGTPQGNYTNAINDLDLEHTLFLCVSWDATYSGLTALIKDLVPGRSLGPVLAKPLDSIGFPLTVWSKTALADRIAYGPLKYAVQYIYDQLEANNNAPQDSGPDLYLVGHSFGTRICDGLMTDDIRDPFRFLAGSARHGFSVPRQDFDLSSFTYQKHLCGAVLIEPALAENGLPADDSLRFLAISKNNIADLPTLAAALSRHEDSVSAFIYSNLNTAVKSSLGQFEKQNMTDSEGLRTLLASALNKIIFRQSIPVEGSGSANRPPLVIKHDLRGRELAIQNREILEWAYTTNVIPRSRPLPFPVLVVQSRNDHLNSLLYPVANIVFNGEITAFYESLEPSSFDAVENTFSYPARSLYEFIMEGLEIPETIITSSELLPFSYAAGQISEFKNRGWAVIPDTLAQLPLVEIPVQSLSPTNLCRGDWGARKGIFDLGPLYESAARVSMGRAANWDTLLTDATVSQNSPNNIAFKTDSVQSRGVTFVDASSKVSTGVYGADYSHATKRGVLADYSVGWIDPVGAHSDFWPHSATNSEIFDFVYFGLTLAHAIKHQ